MFKEGCMRCDEKIVFRVCLRVSDVRAIADLRGPS
jgi:hypothetical protein